VFKQFQYPEPCLIGERLENFEEVFQFLRFFGHQKNVRYIDQS